MAKPPNDAPIFSNGGFAPMQMTARMCAYAERSSPPPPRQNDGKDWCDRAWEARDKAQNERNELRRRFLY